MKQQLIDYLNNGKHSIVIERNIRPENTIENGINSVLAFDTTGIATLLQIVSEDTEMFRGASVVDKVVGKAAAALMIIGGVRELHALLISDGALSLLANTGIIVSYDKRTDHILNRDNTGWCPMEMACRNCRSAAECLTEINECINRLKNKKQE